MEKWITEDEAKAIRNEALKEGAEKAIDVDVYKLAQLTYKLLEDNRLDDIRRVTKGIIFLNELYKEFNI